MIMMEAITVCIKKEHKSQLKLFINQQPFLVLLHVVQSMKLKLQYIISATSRRQPLLNEN